MKKIISIKSEPSVVENDKIVIKKKSPSQQDDSKSQSNLPRSSLVKANSYGQNEEQKIMHHSANSSDSNMLFGQNKSSEPKRFDDTNSKSPYSAV